MKNLTSLFLLLLATTVASAQEISSNNASTPFRANASLGYASPREAGSKGGFLLAVEPTYSVLPNVSVGLRMEAAWKAIGISDQSNNGEYSKMNTLSAIATADYYFLSEGSFKEFVGIGCGVFSVGSVDVSYEGTTLSANAYSTFGAMARAGIEYNRLRISIEYDLVSKTPAVVSKAPLNISQDVLIRNSYFGIKAGFTLGKRKR